MVGLLTARTDLQICRPRCRLRSSSILVAQTLYSVPSQVPVHRCPSQHHRSVSRTMLIQPTFCTIIYHCDNNTKCKCSARRICSLLEPTQMQKTKMAALSPTAPCPRKNSLLWTRATWTSLLASSGRRTCPINSTPCKRDIRQVRRGRPSLLAQPRWYIHRKIIGVLEAAVLVGHMAQPLQ